jgi:hypothetical protein
VTLSITAEEFAQLPLERPRVTSLLGRFIRRR